VCRFAGEIISDGEANIRENDSYMFNLDNKASIEVCLGKKLHLESKIYLEMIRKCISYL